MAQLTVEGHAVIRGVVALPRFGAWHADLDVATDAQLAGAVELSLDGLVLKGVVSSGYRDPSEGAASLRLVGGAGGLRKTARPQHYLRTQFRVPLGELLRLAGEKLSASTDSATLAVPLPHWTVIANPTGDQLTALVSRAAPVGTVWRVLPDGTIWIGRETWPASAVTGWRELGRDPRGGRMVLGLDAPVLLPGTKLGDHLVDYVEHVIDGAAGEIRSHVWRAAA